MLSSPNNSLRPARFRLLLHTSRLLVDGGTHRRCLVTYSVITIGLLPLYIYIYKYTYIFQHFCLYTTLALANMMKGIHLVMYQFFLRKVIVGAVLFLLLDCDYCLGT